MLPPQPSEAGHASAWHVQSVAEALRTLSVSAGTGLSSKEATRRLDQFASQITLSTLAAGLVTFLYIHPARKPHALYFLLSETPYG